MTKRRERALVAHKELVESTKEYEYIRTYFNGDILPNGRVNNSSIYVLVTHKYCDNQVLTRINQFSDNKSKTFNCTKCCGSYENSFAHYIEVELGLDINDVWDFERNIVNPCHISKNTNKKVWLKCLEKEYHGSYQISCPNFTYGKRCSYCNPRNTSKIHLKDTFGYQYPIQSKSWSDNNDKTPFEVTCSSSYIAEFFCSVCGNFFKKSMANLTRRNEWCPHCSSSKGEKVISNWLSYNGIIHIYDQSCFKDLIGLGGGILRPDFILPDHKIWIEYDGEFHYNPIKGDEALKTQQYHDKLKDEYAKKNGWKMIRIPYWDFDNIEEILKSLVYMEVSR